LSSAIPLPTNRSLIHFGTFGQRRGNRCWWTKTEAIWVRSRGRRLEAVHTGLHGDRVSSRSLGQMDLVAVIHFFPGEAPIPLTRVGFLLTGIRRRLTHGPRPRRELDLIGAGRGRRLLTGLPLAQARRPLVALAPAVALLDGGDEAPEQGLLLEGVALEVALGEPGGEGRVALDGAGGGEVPLLAQGVALEVADAALAGDLLVVEAVLDAGAEEDGLDIRAAARAAAGRALAELVGELAGAVGEAEVDLVAHSAWNVWCLEGDLGDRSRFRVVWRDCNR
ncbi:hypothetical protein F5Y15DRAFT_425014, partial [Xylariaceae sp. FL0016]